MIIEAWDFILLIELYSRTKKYHYYSEKWSIKKNQHFKTRNFCGITFHLPTMDNINILSSKYIKTPPTVLFLL